MLAIIFMLENGFPPPTFYQPNVFDAHDDVVGILKRGIANTYEIYEGYDKKHIDLFGFETKQLDDTLKSHINKLKAMLHIKSKEEQQGLIAQISEKKSTKMSDMLKQAFCRIKNEIMHSQCNYIKNTIQLRFFKGFTQNRRIKEAWHLVNTLCPESEVKTNENLLIFRNNAIYYLSSLKNRVLNTNEEQALKKFIRSMKEDVREVNKKELPQKAWTRYGYG